MPNHKNKVQAIQFILNLCGSNNCSASRIVASYMKIEAMIKWAFLQKIKQLSKVTKMGIAQHYIEENEKLKQTNHQISQENSAFKQNIRALSEQLHSINSSNQSYSLLLKKLALDRQQADLQAQHQIKTLTTHNKSLQENIIQSQKVFRKYILSLEQKILELENKKQQFGRFLVQLKAESIKSFKITADMQRFQQKTRMENQQGCIRQKLNQQLLSERDAKLEGSRTSTCENQEEQCVATNFILI